MKRNILKDEIILVVNDDPDIAAFLVERLKTYGVVPDLARSCKEAMQTLPCLTYDLVILDTMSPGCLDLLSLAVSKDAPVVLLVDRAVNAQALRQTIELGARAFLPKAHLGQVAPFLEDVLRLSHWPFWRKGFEILLGVFGKTYGSRWGRRESDFWKRSGENLSPEISPVILV